MNGKKVEVTLGNWREFADCKQLDPELFFPEGESPSYEPQIRAAKRICHACLARTVCLQYALQNNETSGIWGEMTENDRLKLKRAAMRARRTQI